MFEIVLKRDYEDFYFFREFEVNGVTNNSAITNIPQSSRRLASGKLQVGRYLAAETNQSNIKYETPNKMVNNFINNASK